MAAQIKPKSTGKLTSRQLMFLSEYIRNGGNGYRAAVAIGIRAETASSMAAQWLDARRFPLVAAELARLLQEKSQEAVITGRDVLVKLANIIQFNPQDLYDADGNLKPIRELPPEVACCIQKLKVRKRTTTGKDETEIETATTDIDTYSVLDASRLALQAMGILKEGTIVNNQNQANATVVNWDAMKPAAKRPDADIEARIAEVEQMPKVPGHESNGSNGAAKP
jgi:hypothetical protein